MPDITHCTGDIRKCLDEYVDGFLVADELRRAILCPEAEVEAKGRATFAAADRREFIFHLFSALVLGGGLCQFEDQLTPYLDVTRRVYKDLIAVRRVQGRLEVASLVYRVTALPGTAAALFPARHPQNFAYLIIDPVRRHVFFLYHASAVYY